MIIRRPTGTGGHQEQYPGSSIIQSRGGAPTIPVAASRRIVDVSERWRTIETTRATRTIET